MVVGVMEMELILHDNQSLKDKRSVVRSVLQRVRNTFNVSAAEVAGNDRLDLAILGFVSVGNDPNYLRGQLDKLESFVEGTGLAVLGKSRKTIERF